MCNVLIVSPRRNVEFRSLDNSLLALVCADMPDEMRASLEHNISYAVGASASNAILLSKDSAQDERAFACLYFTYYGRSATTVSAILDMREQ